MRGDLLRDVAALNRVELLPWDGWGLVRGSDDDMTGEDLALLDRVAELTTGGNAAPAEMQSLYQSSDKLRVPATVRSYTESGTLMVDVATGETIQRVPSGD